MPWGGYNFEDSILISERLVKDDHFTSIHIEEFECVARDTKLGKEEITRDIPNVGEEALKDLDESRHRAHRRRGEAAATSWSARSRPRARPSCRRKRSCCARSSARRPATCATRSLRVPPGVQGIVISAQVFSRKGTEKDERAKDIEDQEKEKLLADQRDEVKIVSESYHAKMRKLLVGKTTAVRLVDDKGKVLLRQGAEDRRTPRSTRSRRATGPSMQVEDGRQDRGEAASSWPRSCKRTIDAIEALYRDKISKLTKGDELPPGVIKMVKVYVAIKRKLSVGDKMAGRHGNKGVVSRVLPEEDMPYLADGTPVDIVLNPLGVPSRMNVGQILETHLGGRRAGPGQADRRDDRSASGPATRCAAKLKKVFTDEHHQRAARQPGRRGPACGSRQTLREGVHLATPVFDGAKEDDIKALLTLAELATNGQATLFDGKTGEAFDHDVTVGVMYMLKLHHLVDDKIHARSIGPYSLVTQQPLGGKAQFGGQRLGEMEVWAHGGLRRRLRPAGVPDGQVGRRDRPDAHVRGDRQGRARARVGAARVVQRAC